MIESAHKSTLNTRINQMNHMYYNYHLGNEKPRWRLSINKARTFVYSGIALMLLAFLLTGCNNRYRQWEELKDQLPYEVQVVEFTNLASRHRFKLCGATNFKYGFDEFVLVSVSTEDFIGCYKPHNMKVHGVQYHPSTQTFKGAD